ncbi:erythrocyte membrane protein 1 (PfEMP1), truncated, putative [Plasmodium reichenowi]|uniref:Erythrocyte membrane protein 1 (PfEMP1), truncated, putative n=1 Tax=Plasmodium reichenowi TaxID=5854 RepID=A0A2P9DTD3_PLARE|nr:erythrocyte membrane protein 1 (PfEMP1), truncated, putative [Plasmodium reichenowi]
MIYLQRNHQIGMSRMNMADINAKHIFTRKEKKQKITIIFVTYLPLILLLHHKAIMKNWIDLIYQVVTYLPRKLTDNEWNELKQDFIEQYLSYIEPFVPLNHELQTNNIYMYSQFNILHVIMDEKHFIISIQDRFLGSEKELFGTKNTKNITFNRVTTQTNSDPTDSQLDLFHKCLDDIHKINNETYNIISTKKIYKTINTNSPSNKSDEQKYPTWRYYHVSKEWFAHKYIYGYTFS